LKEKEHQRRDAESGVRRKKAEGDASSVGSFSRRKVEKVLRNGKTDEAREKWRRKRVGERLGGRNLRFLSPNQKL